MIKGFLVEVVFLALALVSRGMTLPLEDEVSVRLFARLPQPDRGRVAARPPSLAALRINLTDG